MAEVAEITQAIICSIPGCDQPGTKACSACKTSAYCSVICQTAAWAHHKEECDGHLRKVGKTNLDKADAFQNINWMQSLRYAGIAATKLKRLKDRRLETVQAIDKAMGYTFDALTYLGRYTEAKECAEERYTLWAMNQMRNPGSMHAALQLIQSCMLNKEYERAEHYARHAMFMINDMADNLYSVRSTIGISCSSIIPSCSSHNELGKGWRHPTRREEEGRGRSGYTRTPGTGSPHSAVWGHECR